MNPITQGGPVRSKWNRSAAFALFLLAMGVSISAPRCRAGEPDRYSAPDDRYTAAITTAKTGESKIAIGPSRGETVFSKSFVSADGGHGLRVTKAAWTADSRFFVFMLESSGGHQPWHHPMYFWDRQDNQLYSLDRRMGPITDGFALASPDIVSGTTWSNPGDSNSIDGVPFSVSLRDVAAHSRQSGQQQDGRQKQDSPAQLEARDDAIPSAVRDVADRVYNDAKRGHAWEGR